MRVVEFRGFAGIRLEADSDGAPEDPPILLLHGSGQSRAVWQAAATALVAAGRRIINLDLRGHGGSEWPADARYDIDAFAADLRSVLGQLDARPVIVATTLGGWIALAALADDAATVARSRPTRVRRQDSDGLPYAGIDDLAVSRQDLYRRRCMLLVHPRQCRWQPRLFRRDAAAQLGGVEVAAGRYPHPRHPHLPFRSDRQAGPQGGRDPMPWYDPQGYPGMIAAFERDFEDKLAKQTRDGPPPPREIPSPTARTMP